MPRNTVLDERIAERLEEAMNEAGRNATRKITAIIVKRAQADIPVGDPLVDPNPGFRLRDQFAVKSFGTYVSIEVTAPYAIKVHESRYLKHPRGGGMKFLEKNVIAAIPLWRRLLAEEVKKAIIKEFAVPDVGGAISELISRGERLTGTPAGPGGNLIRFGPPDSELPN